MSFKTWSTATSIGRQFVRSSILNSKVSKQIHDQQKTSLCWAYAISSMLRSSLLYFFESNHFHPIIKANAMFYLEKNEFHKRLRNEITMIPIPKPSIVSDKMIRQGNSDAIIDNIITKQSHNLKLAIFRVSLYAF